MIDPSGLQMSENREARNDLLIDRGSSLEVVSNNLNFSI